MTTWKSARLVPLAVLALSACSGGADDDGDDKDDTQPPVTDTSEDTFEPGGGFLPTSITYMAEFGADANGLHEVVQQGQALPPIFNVSLADDADNACDIFFAIRPEAFGTIADDVAPDEDTDAAEDTDAEDTDAAETDAPSAGGPEGLDAFLTANGLKFGFKVAPGLYDVVTTELCDELPEGFIGNAPDLATWALGLGNGGTAVFVGIDNKAPVDEIVQAFAQSGIPAAKLGRAAFKLPFQFGTAPGAPTTDILDAAFVAGEVDAGWVPKVDGQNLVLLDAAAVWASDAPAQGFYRVISPFGFNLTYN